MDLPTVFIHGWPCVELKINGQGPYLFIVDTGAGGMVVTPRIAREAQVRNTTQKIKVSGGGGGNAMLALISIDQIGAAHFLLKAR